MMWGGRDLRTTGVLALAVSAMGSSAQQPFDLDPSFRTAVDRVYVSSILPTPDGKVLASGLMRFPGEFTDKRLVRFLPDGTRDPLNRRRVFVSSPCASRCVRIQ